MWCGRPPLTWPSNTHPLNLPLPISVQRGGEAREGPGASTGPEPPLPYLLCPQTHLGLWDFAPHSERSWKPTACSST